MPNAAPFLSAPPVASPRGEAGAPPARGFDGPVVSQFDPAGALPLTLSFECFPARSTEGEAALWTTLTRLMPLGPRFISITCGAGGSTRDGTHATCVRLQRELGGTAVAHLTAAGQSRSAVDQAAEALWEAGVRRVLALRGDPPGAPGAGPYEPHPDGYAYATDVVAALRRIAPFEIGVAAYPETHPEAASADADLDHLKRKLDAGAAWAITQFFFDPGVFLRFRDRAAAAGIDRALIPGLLPVSNLKRTRSFAQRCGASVPPVIERLFEGLDEEPETAQAVAAAVTAELAATLRREGCDHIHLYTLNRVEPIRAICHLLGVRPASAGAA